MKKTYLAWTLAGAAGLATAGYGVFGPAGIAGRGEARGPLGHTGIGRIQGSAAPANAPSGPVVSISSANGVSRAVRDIPKGHLVAPRKREMEELEAIGPGHPVPKGFRDPVAQRAIAPADASSAAIVRGFDGISSETSGCGCAPPDTVGAAGTEQYVQMVNSAFAVFSKSGKIEAGPVDINTLFQSLPDGSECKVTNDGDPVVFFDQLANRWVLSQFAVSDNDGNDANGIPYAECIAVSRTADAAGEYYVYEFVFPAPFNVFQDYPHFGKWTDAYYMTTHQFPSNYGGGGVFAFERDKMLAGQPARLVGFTVAGGNTNMNGMLAADLDGTTLPPAGAPAYFVEVDDSLDVGPVDALHIFKFHVDWTNPANSTFGLGNTHTANVSLPVADFSEPFCVRDPVIGIAGFPTCVPQPGESQLDAIGDRLMYRAAYRNFGDHESLVINHSVVVDDITQQLGPRWYEVRGLSGGTPAIYQQGTLAPAGAADPLYRWMGSIAMDKFGNIGLAYSTSSNANFPSIAYVSQAAGAPRGVMSGETQLAAGGGIQPAVARWGDYSSITVDPVDDCTFWYTQEYVKSGHLPTATGPFPWDTHIASFKFPDCEGAPVVEHPVVVVVAPVLEAGSDYENPDSDGTYTLNWTHAAGAVGPDLVQGEPGCDPFLTLDAEDGMGAWTATMTGGQTAPQWRVSNAKPMHAPAAAFWAFGQNNAGLGDGSGILTLNAPVNIPATGTTTLRFSEWYFNEADDSGSVEVSTDGANWTAVYVNRRPMGDLPDAGATAFATEDLTPTEVDLTPYAGQAIRLRFRLQSVTDYTFFASYGWYVDDIQFVNHNWADLATVNGTSLAQAGQADGEMCYRVRTTFDRKGQLITSPFSNVLKVTVQHGASSGGGSLLPDQCDPTGRLPEGMNCLSNIPVIGPALFGESGGGEPDPGATENASCEQNKQLAGGRSYQVKLRTYDGQVNSFQVLEPSHFDCANRANGAHPLLLQGHGYGGSRSTSGFTNYRDAGYTVISIDQRGFGGTSGTVRVMDPDYEGRYLLQILDWAEQNLDYLSWRDESTGAYVARPASKASVANGVNLVVGSMGGSYGGGYQLLILAKDPKKRIDAAQPDITWHDLRNALNPGDVIKAQYDTLLFGAGEATSGAAGVQNSQSVNTQDPFIKEAFARGGATGEFPRQALDWFRYHSMSHWCGAAGLPVMPYPAYGADLVPMADATNGDNTPPKQSDGRPGKGSLTVPQNPLTHFQGLSVLLTQGTADTLFNFNEAWWNYQCLSAAGADVSLYMHNGGHGLVATTPGDTVNDFDGASCNANAFGWFNSKLKPDGAPAPRADVCFVVKAGDTFTMNAGQVLAPQPALGLAGGAAAGYVERDVSAQQVPNGLAAVTAEMGAAPIEVPLGTVQNAGLLAGMPHVRVTIASVAGLNEMAQDCADSVAPGGRLGCDSVTFVGLGLKRAGSTGAAQLIDDQLRPLRGLGVHDVDLVGVTERLAVGDQLSLVLYGTHLQYYSSYSRDITIPAVNVIGTVQLPIYGANADGSPNFATGQRVLSGGTAPVDSDGDGVADETDNCTMVANPDQADFDGDGAGDACDADDDNDGVDDAGDAFPRDASETVDSDGDGIGNNADTDDDNDGVSDADEAALGTDPLNADSDADGVNDGADNCATTPNSDQADVDGDGIGDACDPVDDRDTSPDPFTFVERDNVVTGAVITSEAKALGGFGGALPVSVSTNNNSQYSVNGGAWTSAAGQVHAGDTLAVRHVSASTASTQTDTVVTVGTYSTTFTSVTSAADRTPDPFTFGTKTGVVGGSVVESDPVTLTGFNAAISLTAGPGLSYSIDGGAWTAASGSLSPGQVLKVRHTATTTSMGYTKTYLKAGGVTGYFTTRTK